MGLVIVLLGQMTVLPDLLLTKTAQRLVRHRFLQYLTPKEQSGKGQYLFQFLPEASCLPDAQKHFRLHPVQHPTPDDDRMILGHQNPFPQMGHLLRLFRQHRPGQGQIVLGLGLRGRQDGNVLSVQPVLCRRRQAILRRQIEYPFSLTDTNVVPDSFGSKDCHGQPSVLVLAVPPDSLPLGKMASTSI